MTLLDHCARCGRCLAVCPIYKTYKKETVSPRGKVALLQKILKENKKYPSFYFELCLLCGACQEVCPNNISLVKEIISIRNKILLGGKFISSILKYPKAKYSKIDRGIFYFFSHLPLSITLPKHSFKEQISLSPQGEISLFLGCGTNFLYPQAGISLVKKLKQMKITIGIPPEQTCCGLIFLSLGNLKRFYQVAQKNLLQLSSTKGPIITLCSSCAYTLKKIYPQLFKDTPWQYLAKKVASRIYEVTEYLYQEKKIISFLPPGVALHVPCHQRFSSSNRWWKKIKFYIEECCGQGGLWAWKYPKASKIISRKLIIKLQEFKIHTLLTTCTACYIRLNFLYKGYPQIKLPIEILEIDKNGG